MSNLAAIAAILSSAVALVGAVVAFTSVYITYRNRHNQFRQVVYGRQMDAYFDITESMSILYTAAQNILADCNPWLKGEDARTRFQTALREEHERFTATVNRSLIVLPSKVKAAIDHFNDTLLAFASPADEKPPAQHGPAAPPPAAAEELSKAYERAVNCIRHHLAVDSLTTGLLKEMGIGSESVTMQRFRSSVNPLLPVGRSAP